MLPFLFYRFQGIEVPYRRFEGFPFLASHEANLTLVFQSMRVRMVVPVCFDFCEKIGTEEEERVPWTRNVAGYFVPIMVRPLFDNCREW